MDKATAKLVLESYRPDDADDPIFAEALRLAADDPELATWFEEAQRFDSVLTGKMKGVPVPAYLKQQILLGYQAAKVEAPVAKTGRTRVWILGGAVAAALTVGFSAWQLWGPAARPANRLALQAISFTDQMPALQFVCFNAAEVARWVNEQPGSKQVGLVLPKPAEAMSMKMIGSSVVDWNGRPVVMVCLQNGQQMAMLYIMSDQGAGDLEDGVTAATVQKADWVVKTTRANGQIRVLTAKGRPESLNFPMPL